MSEDSLKVLEKMFQKLKKKHNIRFVTITQPPKKTSNISRLDLGMSDVNLVIIDHINLIK